MLQNTHKSAPKGDKPVRPRQRITARALLEVKRLSDPQVHPDGQRIAFVVTEADFEESRQVSHLWLTECALPLASEEPTEMPAAQEPEKASGENRESPAETEEDAEEEDDAPTRQLTYSHDGESMPRWSPDGHYLAFLSVRPDESESDSDEEEDAPKEQIWVLPIDGGEARKLTSAKEGVTDYAWTPDSKELVYLAQEPRPRPVDSARKDDRERRKIDPVVEHEDRLRYQFWRIGVDEKKPVLLFTGDYGIQEFTLSPDGERLCYATNYTGDWNDYHLVDLWILNIATKTTFKLVARAGGKYCPRWSSEGTRIAFLSWLQPELSYSRESLFVADVPPVPVAAKDADGTAETPAPATETMPEPSECRLLTEMDYDITTMDWSHHDGQIVTIAAVGTGSELYRIDTETTQLELGARAERSWLALDPHGSAIFFVQECVDALPELYRRDAEGEVKALTRLNTEFSERHLLPRQEVVSWQSPDGLAIEGVLTYPIGYEEGKRYPLITQIHGGPKGRATHTLRSYPLTPVWSAEGYAVLQPNFRGSEGYGNAFAIANRRDLGGGDFADIMAGVDWCIAQGIADPDRLGVMGGSYGGYMTNWAIGHTDRFRAAVSMFGIFHLQTDYSNSELSRWDNDYLGAYYWEDPEIYRRLSPGSYIDNIKTPTLILHGDDDNNTFISNSKELYQALRHRGVTTQFVHYPREGHGLREPNHRLDEIRRSLAWMDRYVRHGGGNPGVYRIGDKVPSPDGKFELCVTRSEIPGFLGQPQPDPKSENSAMTYLEIVATFSQTDSRIETGIRTLELSDLRLEPRADSEQPAFPMNNRPIGVPMDVPGGKVLVQGDNLRIVQHPDKETGQLAFGLAAVFCVPKAGGECLFTVGDFPPVEVVWGADNSDEEESPRDTDHSK